VNIHLNDHFSHCLPQCRLSDFRTREVAGPDETVSLDIDAFGYLSRDSLEFGSGSPGSGISLIEPDGCTREKAVAAPPAKPTGSTCAKVKSVETGVEKYIIGETYSGQEETTLMEKVTVLEEKIEKMVGRFNNTNTNSCEDVTSVVGAALLAYFCGPMKRRDAAEKFSEYVNSTLTKDSMPHLWRLAQARRLFLLVMSANDSPYSTAHRATFQVTEGIELSLSAIEENMSAMKEKLDRMSVIEEKLDRVLNIM